MADTPCQPPDPNPKKPEITPPPGSVDTHAHIYGPFDRFPLAHPRNYTPHPLGFETYCRVLDALGIDRAVIVQGSANGANHAVTLDAIARSEGRFRGICIVRPETPMEDIDALADTGICGLRVSATAPGGLRPAHVEPMMAKAKELGWLVEIHLRNIDELLPLISWIEKANVPVLIDHLGRPRGGQGVDRDAFQALLAMLRDTDHVWAKICSWYRLSDSGPPYEDMRPFVEALIAARPDRLVWGTNWPHPNITIPMPNDGFLLDQLMEWAGDRDLQRMILCDNPTHLHGFDRV
jgi:2-pyrone-4,6-dicarboxylate lactonase